MCNFWEIKISSCGDDRPFWIDLTGLPGVRCPACGNTWGVIHRLPQCLPPEVDHKLKFVRGPVSMEKYRDIRDFVIQNVSLSADTNLFEPGVRLGATRIVKCHAGAPSRCYVFLRSLFLPEALAKELTPFDGNGLFLMRCKPRYEWLVEIVPIPCPRNHLFPVARCIECGIRSYEEVDKHFFKYFLNEKETSECMLKFPGIQLVTDNIKRILESMALPQVTFEHVSFSTIWTRMTNNLMQK